MLRNVVKNVLIDKQQRHTTDRQSEHVSKPRILQIDLTLDTNSDEKVKPFLYKLKNYSSN